MTVVGLDAIMDVVRERMKAAPMPDDVKVVHFVGERDGYGAVQFRLYRKGWSRGLVVLMAFKPDELKGIEEGAIKARYANALATTLERIEEGPPP